MAKAESAPNLVGMGQMMGTPAGSIAAFVAGRQCVNCLVLLDFGLPRMRGLPQCPP